MSHNLSEKDKSKTNLCNKHLRNQINSFDTRNTKEIFLN